MNNKLLKFIPLADFLAKILGNNTEVVLHSVSEDDNEKQGIFYIVNNHISGRQVGDPLTDMGLKWINEKTYLYHKFKVGYYGKAKFNKRVLSSTYFVMDDDDEKLIGMLCINTDTSNYKDFFVNLLTSLNVPLNSVFDEEDFHIVNNNGSVIVENLAGSLDKQIENILLKYDISIPVGKLKPKQRKEIIIECDNQGLFMIKGSVQRVAELLNMSIPSIYRHINNKEK